MIKGKHSVDENERAVKYIVKCGRAARYIKKLIITSFIVIVVTVIVSVIIDNYGPRNFQFTILDIIFSIFGWIMMASIAAYFITGHYISKKLDDPGFVHPEIEKTTSFYLDDQKDRKEYEEMENVMKKEK